MHLINQKVGGIGTPINWTPAPGRINTGSTVIGFETSIKDLLKKKNNKDQPNVLWIKTKVEKNREYAGLPHFPEKVSFKAGLHFYKDKAWKKDGTARISVSVEVPEPEGEELPSLSDPSYTLLSKVDPAVFYPNLCGSYETEKEKIQRPRRL